MIRRRGVEAPRARTEPSRRLTAPSVSQFVEEGEVQTPEEALRLARVRWEDEFLAWIIDYTAEAPGDVLEDELVSFAEAQAARTGSGAMVFARKVLVGHRPVMVEDLSFDEAPA